MGLVQEYASPGLDRATLSALRPSKVYKVDSKTMADTPPIGELEQLILLAILRLGPDAYGLSVARELEAQAGRRLSRGALYTSLDRLEAKGFLRWTLEPGGPERQSLPKRVYVVLPRGVSALRTSQRVLRRMWRGLDGILKGQS
jgi:PadR family transcriptional regulator, regulatory protein PadR